MTKRSITPHPIRSEIRLFHAMAAALALLTACSSSAEATTTDPPLADEGRWDVAIEQIEPELMVVCIEGGERRTVRLQPDFPYGFGHHHLDEHRHDSMPMRVTVTQSGTAEKLRDSPKLSIDGCSAP